MNHLPCLHPVDAPRLEDAAVLLDFALDLTGLFDPAPFRAGASPLAELAGGRWLQQAAHTREADVPFVAELARAGRLPRYLRALERAVALAEGTCRAAALLPGARQLARVLAWLPTPADPYLDQAERLARAFVRRHGPDPDPLRPDVSRRFIFTTVPLLHYFERVARGRLGVPGRVRTHHDGDKHEQLSYHTGEDASHLIGARFGGPDTAENLALQNRSMNRGHDWKKVEEYWDRQLRAGVGIDVEIIDVYRRDESRPLSRKASWTEHHPDGAVLSRRLTDLGNWDSDAARDARARWGPAPEGGAR